MSEELMKTTRQFYDKIKCVYESPRLKNYPLSPIWAGENMRSMRETIATSPDAIQAIHKMMPYEPLPSCELAVDWHLKAFKKAGIDVFTLPLSIQESEYAPPESIFIRNGRKFRADFFRYLDATLSVVKYLSPSDKEFRIFELGGGCGNLARLIKLSLPNCRYVIVDLPEMLCFSYMFINLHFPNQKTLFVTDESDLSGKFFEEYDFVFAPISFEDCLLKYDYDLFLNTASLGEMRSEVIRYWMNFIQDKLNPNYIVSINRYLNTITSKSHGWRLNENLCSVLYDKNWGILEWELEPLSARCPFANTNARLLSIIAKRLSSVSDDELRQKSKLLHEEAKLGGWRNERVVMTGQDNVIVNDTTMDGILFRIWESIRLNPNKDNIRLMIEYLETLLRREDREFEEVFYYEDLLLKLHNQKPDKDSYEVQKWIAARRKRWERKAKSFHTIFQKLKML